MNIEKIAIGKNPPEDFNVIIEIGAYQNPIKYEFDKEASAIVVDRFMPAPMFYPANYGFIPHTLADDGDPTDVLVVTPEPLTPGVVINCRAVGVLVMSDESGQDEKILAYPNPKLTAQYNHIQDIDDVDELLKNQIQHFFENYKKLEPGKWVKVENWQNADSAKKIIQNSIQ